MLKHRLSKFGRVAFVSLCALFAGGIMQSCTDEFDDYKYDDEEPSWLGASIYDFLKGEQGARTYNYYTAIIDSLGYTDVLASTGSKTVFVADDAAFERFFQNNRWGVSSFSELSKAQMKILLYSSMLDNAYLLDMMSSLPGNPPVEGSCLRRLTSSQAVDSIPYFTPEMLPTNNSHWDNYRDKGLLLATDGTDPMMVHFLREYMKSKSITSLDVNVFFNADRSTPRSGDEAFIYQNQVLASGIDFGEYSDDTLTITCKNGYIYRMDGVLVPPSNMAEELRQHDSTKVFSYMIDRFSAPIYSADLSQTYNYVNDNTNDPDSVFVMRYINKSEARPLYKVENGASVAVTDAEKAKIAALAFDPGWNTYRQGSSAAEGDMAAMLVPKDVHIYNYFKSGAGKFLVDLYAPEVVLNDNDYTSIIPALDSIPSNIIASFINNLMLPTFSTSVPSKFDQVYNDGTEIMGVTPENVDECVVANNGVIYILNQVFGPVDYRAVSAPPLTMTNMTIMRAAIQQLGYNSYLKAMDATYSFIVPDDEYFVYYDPVTIVEAQQNADGSPGVGGIAYKFFYDNKYRAGTNVAAKIWAKRYYFGVGNDGSYVVTDTIANYAVEGTSVNTKFAGVDRVSFNYGWGAPGGAGSPAGFLYNRMTDLLEYLIIVGDVEDGNSYYLSKGYGTIKCDFDPTLVDADGKPAPESMTFYGGEQIENGTSVSVLTRYPEDNGVTYCTYSEDINLAANGDTLVSGIPTPPTQTVYFKLNESATDSANAVKLNAKKFFNVCNGPEDMDLISFFRQIYPGIDSSKLQRDTLPRYAVFYGKTNTTNGSGIPRDYTVPFFSTYHYTVYVPTDEAVEDAYALGLPTWEQLQAELADTVGGVDKTGKVIANIRLINKFARYHFQDNSVFVDKKDFSVTSAGETSTSARFETAAIDEETGRFFETIVQSTNSTVGNSRRTLSVTDDLGNTATVLNRSGEEGESWNIMTRDILMFCKGAAAINSSRFGHSIETSSFAVLHQVDKALLNGGLLGYDGKFCRYSNGGQLVDTMAVAGGKGSLEIDGKNVYLVGQRDNIVVTDAEGYETYKRVAYLMKKNENSTSNMDMEEYVLDEGGNPILITSDGARVAEIIKKNASGKVLSVEYKFADAEGNYSYKTTDENGKEVEKMYTEPQVWYNNDGTTFVK